MYDMICLLSICIVLCLVLLLFPADYLACCLPRRMEIRRDAHPDAVFGYDIIRNWTPRYRVGAVPKTIPSYPKVEG